MISGALLKEMFFLQLATLALLILKHTLVQAVQPVQARGALETVRLLCQRINEVMIYAQNTGLIDAVPSVNIGKAFERPQKKNMPSIRPGSATSTDADNANSKH